MNTKTAIYHALLQELEQKPIESIKVSRIIETANVSRSTFYFYFGSVAEAVDSLEDDFINGITEEHTAIEKIANYIRTGSPKETLIRPTIEYVGRNLNTFRVLTGPNGNPEFRDKLCTRIYHIYKSLFTNFTDNSAETALICEVFASSQWAIYSWWANHENETSSTEIIDFVAKYLSYNTPFFARR